MKNIYEDCLLSSLCQSGMGRSEWELHFAEKKNILDMDSDVHLIND